MSAAGRKVFPFLAHWNALLDFSPRKSLQWRYWNSSHLVETISNSVYADRVPLDSFLVSILSLVARVLISVFLFLLCMDMEMTGSRRKNARGHNSKQFFVCKPSKTDRTPGRHMLRWNDVVIVWSDLKNCWLISNRRDEQRAVMFREVEVWWERKKSIVWLTRV